LIRIFHWRECPFLLIVHYMVEQINFETIDKNQIISLNRNNNSEIQITGWAIHIANNKIAESVYLCIDNKTIGSVEILI
jgi:hypothetical protein